jgi:hypothetical protein
MSIHWIRRVHEYFQPANASYFFPVLDVIVMTSPESHIQVIAQPVKYRRFPQEYSVVFFVQTTNLLACDTVCSRGRRAAPHFVRGIQVKTSSK